MDVTGRQLDIYRLVKGGKAAIGAL